MLVPLKRFLGMPFGVIARLRAWAYARRLFSVHRVSVPVISVGNLSVGGTGKTPLVIHLVEYFRARGLRPGVLARGYGKRPDETLNDEGRLLEMRFPGLPQVQMPDRVAGAGQLLAAGKVDVIILDDGFQHRRLGRDLDIVCLDCTRPWFHDAPLPGGLLREPAGALQRADLLMLTRSGDLTPAQRGDFAKRGQAASGGKPLSFASHCPKDILGPEAGSPPLSTAELAGKKVYLFAGIGAPQSFHQTILSLGAQVLGMKVFPDHGKLAPQALAEVAMASSSVGADWLVTTEKDLARIGKFPFPVYVLRVDLELADGGEELGRQLARIVRAD